MPRLARAPRAGSGAARPRSASVAHARRDGLDGAKKRLGPQLQLLGVVLGLGLARAAQQDHLRGVERIKVQVALVEPFLQLGRLAEQLILLRDAHHLLDARVILVLDEAVYAIGDLLVFADPRVLLGDLHVGLDERLLDVCEEVAEERPTAVHVPHLLEALLRITDVRGQRRANAVPRRQSDAALRPAEHPRDGPQRLLRAVARLALGGPATHIERTNLVANGCRVVVVVEALRVVGEAPVRLLAPSRQLAHQRHELRLVGKPRARFVGVGLQQPRHAHAQLVLGCVGVAVLVGDRLALLCELDGAVDRAGRLRQDGLVRGARAAPHGAATAVEELPARAGALADGLDGALRRVEREGAAHDAAVLGAVRVADHDVLHVAGRREVRAVHVGLKERGQRLRHALQVRDGLEERAHANFGVGPRAGRRVILHEPLANHPAEGENLQDIRGRAGHGDVVLAEGLHVHDVSHRGHRLENLHALDGVGRARVHRRDELVLRGRRVSDGGLEDLHALRLVELSVVGAAPEGAQNLVHSLDVARALLADVERLQAKAEGLHQADEVLQGAGGGRGVAALGEEVLDELEVREQLRRGFVLVLARAHTWDGVDVVLDVDDELLGARGALVQRLVKVVQVLVEHTQALLELVPDDAQLRAVGLAVAVGGVLEGGNLVLDGLIGVEGQALKDVALGLGKLVRVQQAVVQIPHALDVLAHGRA
mmetsp:Transcript_11934/g.50206  ORF Transcript_11934/g.50206 Transcript_11934/m.50206 type:complete len:711 (+) Transcript_11934:117-2249(+)